MNEVDVTEGKLLPRVWQLAYPAVFQAILSNCYSFNDFLFVGHIKDKAESAAATAALSATVGLQIVVFALHNIIPSGANSYCSQFKGAKDNQNLALIFRAAFYSCLILSSVISFIALVSIDFISSLCNSSEDVQIAIKTFLGIILISSPAFGLLLLVDGFFKSLGDTKTPLRLEIASLTINVILNYIFVIQLNLGIGGSAIATSISRLLPALYGLSLILLNKTACKNVSLSLKLNINDNLNQYETLPVDNNDNQIDDIELVTKSRRESVDSLLPSDNSLYSNIIDIKIRSLQMATIGVFQSFASTIYGLVFTSLIRLAGELGDKQQAGLGSGLRGIEWIAFCLSEGFLEAACTSVGQCIGAKLYKRAFDAAMLCCLLSSLSAGIVGIPFILFSTEISSILSTDRLIIKYCAQYVYVNGFVLSLIGFEMASYGSLLGAGMTRTICIVNGSMNVLRIPITVLCLYYNRSFQDIFTVILWVFGLHSTLDFTPAGNFYCIAGAIAGTASAKAFIWMLFFTYKAYTKTYFSGFRLITDEKDENINDEKNELNNDIPIIIQDKRSTKDGYSLVNTGNSELDNNGSGSDEEFTF